MLRTSVEARSSCDWDVHEKNNNEHEKAMHSLVLFSNTGLLATDYGCLPYLAFNFPSPIIRIVSVQRRKCIHTFICTCKLSNNQLHVRHQWLVYECTSFSAKDVLDNSGQIQLEAMSKLMYISMRWHVQFWVSQYHITLFAVQPFLVLVNKTVLNVCSFRIPGNLFTHLTCNLSLGSSTAGIAALGVAVECSSSRKTDQVDLWITYQF